MERTFSFGYWVRRQRKALDLTQAELGRQVGCAVVTIQKIEADERRPSRQLAARLADFLQVSPDERDDFINAARAKHSADNLELVAAPLPVAVATDQVSLPPVSLPIPPYPLIGREQELRHLHAMLARHDTRLVTLTGVGGSGKTRLALALATELATHISGERFPDGIWWVDFAPLRDPELVTSAVAQTLGIPQSQDLPLRDVLLHRLRNRHLLLIFDNCEHLVDAVADLTSDILATASAVQLLITSRSLLRLHAEEVFDVPPLTIPPAPWGMDRQEWRTSDTDDEAVRAASTGVSDDMRDHPLLQYDAVRLFITRAQAVAPEIVLNAGNVAAIAAICRLVDGLPLAIELAAVHLRALPPAVLLAQLQAHGALVLEGAARDIPARQRTMRSAIAWSYDLLPPDAQRLFRRLGVFAGGWSLEAAAAVVEDIVDESRNVGETTVVRNSTLAILTLLETLLDHSLIVRLADVMGEARFSLLEPVREFALEQLRRQGEEMALRWRHVSYFARWIGQLEERWGLPSQPAIIARQAVELYNCRAALAWLLDTGDQGARRNQRPDVAESEQKPEVLALKLVLDLALMLRYRGFVKEAQSWIERALAQCPEAAARLQFDGHNNALFLACLLGDVAACRAHAEAEMAIARREEDPAMMAWALIGSGVAPFMVGEYYQACDWHEQALSIARRIESPSWPLRAILSNFAFYAACAGQHQRAIALGEEGVAVARALNAVWGLGETLLNLGIARMLAGDWDQVQPNLEEARRIFSNMQDQRLYGAALLHLGVLARWRGDLAVARRLIAEALELGKTMGALWVNTTNELHLALLALDQGDLAAAAGYVAGPEQWQESGNPHSMATAAGVHALILLVGGDLAEAERVMETGLTPLRARGATPVLPAQHREHAWCLPRALGVAGLLAAHRGDYATGTALLEQALYDERQPRFAAEETRLRADLGRVRLWVGDLARAAELLHQALAECRDMRARPLAARVLQDQAALALQQDDAEHAARLLGAADALRDELEMARWPLEQSEYDELVAATRAALGAAAYAAAWQTGRDRDWREFV